MLSQTEKAFNATPAGQRAMCEAAWRRSVVLLLNRKVRQLGGDGEAWHDMAIETANESTLNAIKEDLLPIYNRLCAERNAKPAELSQSE